MDNSRWVKAEEFLKIEKKRKNKRKWGRIFPVSTKLKYFDFLLSIKRLWTKYKENRILRIKLLQSETCQCFGLKWNVSLNKKECSINIKLFPHKLFPKKLSYSGSNIFSHFTKNNLIKIGFHKFSPKSILMNLLIMLIYWVQQLN